MELTQEERDILAHVVVDPDAWVAHAVSVRGEEQAVKDLAAKVARWKPEYEKAKESIDYKTRAERDAIENIKPVPTEEQLYEAQIKTKEAEILKRQAIAEITAEKAAEIG